MQIFYYQSMYCKFHKNTTNFYDSIICEWEFQTLNKTIAWFMAYTHSWVGEGSLGQSQLPEFVWFCTFTWPKIKEIRQSAYTKSLSTLLSWLIIS